MTTPNDTTLNLDRVNISKQWDMVKATAKRDHRFATACVSLRAGYLEATNGRIAVQHPIAYEGLDVLMGAETWKAARKAGVFHTNGATVNVGTCQHLPESGNFPPVRNCIPESKEGNTTVTLNATLLKQLADALGAGGDGGADRVVTLEIEAANRPVRVTCSTFPDSIGVIMPLVIKD